KITRTSSQLLLALISRLSLSPSLSFSLLLLLFILLDDSRLPCQALSLLAPSRFGRRASGRCRPLRTPAPPSVSFSPHRLFPSRPLFPPHSRLFLLSYLSLASPTSPPSSLSLALSLSHLTFLSPLFSLLALPPCSVCPCALSDSLPAHGRQRASGVCSPP